MIKPYIIPVLILALLVMAFGWLRSCEKAKEITQQADVTQWRTVIDGLQTDTASLRTQNRELTRRIAQDSTKAAKDIRATQTKTKAQKAAAVVLQPQIDVISDSLPILREYVALKDSIIHGQDETIAQISQAYTVQVKGLNKQIAIHAEIQAKNDEIMRLYEERIAKLMKDNRKERRGKRFFRTTTLIMVGAVGILLLAK